MKSFLKIVLGNILITAAYAWICVPLKIMNGGLTSFSMILSGILPLNTSVIVDLLSVLLLVLAWLFLGREFFQKSIFSSISYVVFFSIFSAYSPDIDLPVILAVIIAGSFVGAGYYLCIDAGSSAVSFDVVALILHQKNEKINVAVTIRIILILVILFGVTRYGMMSAVTGISFTLIQTEILQLLMKRKENTAENGM